MHVTDLREAIHKAYDWPGYSTIPDVRERTLAHLSEAKDSLLAFLCAPLPKRSACSCATRVATCLLHGIPKPNRGIFNANAGGYPDWMKPTRNRRGI